MERISYPIEILFFLFVKWYLVSCILEADTVLKMLFLLNSLKISAIYTVGFQKIEKKNVCLTNKTKNGKIN